MAGDIALDGLWLSQLPTGGRAVVAEIAGWWDSPEPNILDDGEPDPNEPWLPRVISIEGNVHARSHDELHATGEMLTSMLRQRGTLTVVGHGPTMHAQVTRSARVRFSTITDRLGVWSATLRASDPRKYGGWQSPVTIGSDALAGDVFHRGNTDAAPVIRVNGVNLRQGYRITHEDGRVFEVRSPLYSNVSHVVDMATGRAYDGADTVARYGVAQQIQIHHGPAQSMQITPIGEGTVSATVEVQDTWI